jgi:hypothetical protein
VQIRQSLDDLRAVFDTSPTRPQSPVTPGYTLKISQRLSDATRDEIAAAYAAGADSTDGAAQYSLARNTVLRLAREHQVPIRRQPVQADRLLRVAGLYESGRRPSTQEAPPGHPARHLDAH